MFQELLLLLIIPVVVGIVVALLVYAPTLAGKHKPSSAELLRRERAEKALEAESDTARIES
ncbi:hypothetical protein CGZ91_00945 [Parenemella sanctibonifatiensis]|uniref:Uncharacterized protein n=1 Tax=Parenemella sanctibonifatiensis TaxID=2016505 RepID=A0A255EKR5_9ACTN|nr:hypothetical protein CGZ92_05965 [Parenemella sanctibonifatiensis]OYN92116.1 hypothetical protein CGZ91_00945 [Parenemella sanctibonifatiensis]